jgi:hypothetical protein
MACRRPERVVAFRETTPEGDVVIVLGIILLVVGYLLPVPAFLTTIGWILIIVGLVLELLYFLDRPLLGRRHYF